MSPLEFKHQFYGVGNRADYKGFYQYRHPEFLLVFGKHARNFSGLTVYDHVPRLVVIAFCKEPYRQKAVLVDKAAYFFRMG